MDRFVRTRELRRERSRVDDPSSKVDEIVIHHDKLIYDIAELRWKIKEIARHVVF